jgi:hypothetical protein
MVTLVSLLPLLLKMVWTNNEQALHQHFVRNQLCRHYDGAYAL